MLVFTRKPGEEIIITDDIRVMFCGLDKHGRARIGVQAPREIPVHRREVYDQIHQDEVDEHYFDSIGGE